MATQGRLPKDSNNKSFKRTEEIIFSTHTTHSIKRVVSYEEIRPGESPNRNSIFSSFLKFIGLISAAVISLISKLVLKHF